MDTINIADTARKAGDIMDGYSEGTLPRPEYVTLMENRIHFGMKSPADVQRWARSVDAQVMTRPHMSNGKRDMHHTFSFAHGDTYVEVYHVEHLER